MECLFYRADPRLQQAIAMSLKWTSQARCFGSAILIGRTRPLVHTRHALPPLLSTVQQRHHTTSNHTDPTHELPESVQSWIHDLTSAPPRLSSDLVDANRAESLYATLPTRTYLSSESSTTHHKTPSSWLQTAGMGAPLEKGWTLCYHWAKSNVDTLGDDGTSRVSFIILVLV